MKDKICATIDKNHLYLCNSKTIGRQGENLCMQLELTLEDCLCDSWVYLHFEKPDGTTKVTERLEIVGNVATYDIGNDLLDIDGSLKVFVELHNNDGLVWKSSTKTYTVLSSFNGTDQIENKTDFITEAQNLLDEIEEGLTPTIGENENWFICDKDTGKTSRGPKGDDYEITEEDYEEIGEQVKTDIQPLLNDINETSDEALEVAKNAENIAKGKSSSIVKNTWAEMEEWLKDVANKGTHSVGDNLYIKEMWIDEEAGIRQPDYWITEVLETPNELGYYYNISDLGVEHPDLTNLISKDETKEKYLLITYEDETTETVKLVVYK